jgi:hypothetical protein
LFEVWRRRKSRTTTRLDTEKIRKLREAAVTRAVFVLYCCMRVEKLAWAGVAVFAVCGIAGAATIVATDDAADAAYNGGIYFGQNGGFGLSAFQTNGFPFGGNPNLIESVSTSTLNGIGGPDIDTAGRAWGNNAIPGGNTFIAKRSLLFDLTIGGTLSISMDTGSCDGKESIAFGRNNNVMCEFYFIDTQPNYQFYDALSNTTNDTGILQTFGGLRLTLTRESASTYSFRAVRLSDALSYNFAASAYDTTAIPGIRTLTLNNADGGNGPGHAMFVNSIEATQLPEPSSLMGIGASCGALGLRRRRRRR